jgi:hypothetical protein
MLKWDVSEVRKLAADLGEIPVKAVPEVRAITQKGALNIKQDWQARWRGHPTFPALPSAVSYDTRITAGFVEAEIGPDKGRRQGALGNIIEFGTPNNAPIPAGMPALNAELPKYEKALAEALTKLME